MNAPDSDTPSEAALKAARDIFWGFDWPGGAENYPDDLEEIIDMARTIDRYTLPNNKPYQDGKT